MMMPSAWPQNRPPTAEKLSAVASGSKRKPAPARSSRLRVLEDIAAEEDVAHPLRMHGVHHPVVLHAAQTLAADRAGAEVLAVVDLGLGRRLDQALIAALIGAADKQARLKSTTLPQGHGFDQLVSGQQEPRDIIARPFA